jgi:four helix bundle protein
MKTEDKPDIEGRTYAFALRVVQLDQVVGRRTGAARVIGNQLLRSGTSVGANVEEAHAAQSRPDFVSKMSIALKEARESRYWLRLLSDSQLVPADRIAPLLTEATEIMRILGAIVATCRRNDARR